ncbi:MAG TPA: 4Fe-4S binding protein [Methanocorpusculum sp.]|nr:4Fe-4S binding protein [Methanocorpusculum sp.]HJJ27109.1 4Fe-4S binding protein [Methanocorpusculum sp.]
MPLGIGCTARPGKGRNNKTGSWRVYYPILDTAKCTKCGTCQLICPEGCVYQNEDKTYAIDLDYCKGCGLCAAECPDKAKAISMHLEEK